MKLSLKKLNSSKSSNGFALISSLALMVFIFLLLTALTVHTTVESKASEIQPKVEVARKNALVGLRVALSQLRKHVGPDQRVTARADILQEHNGNFEFDTEGIANPYYTLAWDVSGSEDNSPQDEPGHDIKLEPVVLVSGIENEDDIEANELLKEDLRNDDDAVWLVGSKDYYNNIDRENNHDPELVDVIVKKNELYAGNGDGLGNYAWWVGDEGVKARINITAPEEIDEPYEWTTAQRRSIEVLEGFETLNLDRISEIHELESLQLLEVDDLDGGQIWENYHDLTMHSKAVFTDVKHGRLKQDLSYGLDENNSAPREIADETYMIETISDLGGIQPQNSEQNGRAAFADIQYCQWGVLRDYYNFKEDSQVDGRPHMLGNNNYEMGISPVITRFQHGIYVNRATNNQILVYHQVAVALWNPYNVDMRLNSMNLTHTEGNDGGPLVLIVNDQSDDIEAFNGAFTLKGPFTIPAGKSLVFSPEGTGLGSYDDYDPTKVTIADGENVLAPGFRDGAALVQKIPLSDKNKLLNNRITLTLKGQRVPGTLPSVDNRYGLTTVRATIALHHGTEATGGYGGASNANMGTRACLIPLVSSSVDPDYIEDGVISDWYRAQPTGFPGPRFLFVYAMKFSENEFGYGIAPSRLMQWNGNFNPRAYVHNRTDRDKDWIITGIDTDLDRHSAAAYFGGFVKGADAQDEYTMPTDGDYGFVGNSAINASGSQEASLYEIQPTDTVLTSLAQLGHAQITAIDNEHPKEHATANGVNFPGSDHANIVHTSSDNFAPSYAIGSSLAPPLVDLDRVIHSTSRSDAGKFYHRTWVWDYSYLLNDLLFDRYFFSTIPQDDNFDQNTPLPNSLYKPYGNIIGREDEMKDFDRAAAYLMMDGGFNVNSTSVNAWSAFLASLKNVDVNGEPNEGTPFVRLTNTLGEAIDGDYLDPFEEEVVTGYRSISDEEIRDLAEKIVEQVKLRGPFPSMSAFVNRCIYPETLYKQDGLQQSIGNIHDMYERSLSGDTYVQLKGALESALEQADLNQPFFINDDYVVTESPSHARNTSPAYAGSVANYTPGYLSQMDLLSRLGAGMTVRSDTFVIRAYGDNSDDNGRVISQARCEAVVQRIPEFTDKQNDRWDELEYLSEDNLKWGRQFRVVSMRWLDDQEI